ncbi:MAG: hypothetical protein U0U09_14300 [Cyclobacteriaceae bacterium]
MTYLRWLNVVMYESSFVFTLDEAGEKWEQRDGQHYRTISKVSGL